MSRIPKNEKVVWALMSLELEFEDGSKDTFRAEIEVDERNKAHIVFELGEDSDNQLDPKDLANFIQKNIVNALRKAESTHNEDEDEDETDDEAEDEGKWFIV